MTQEDDNAENDERVAKLAHDIAKLMDGGFHEMTIRLVDGKVHLFAKIIEEPEQSS